MPAPITITEGGEGCCLSMSGRKGPKNVKQNTIEYILFYYNKKIKFNE